MAMISKSPYTDILVHVTTRAHINAVDGWKNGVLYIRIRAVAEKGKANKAVLELLSAHFSVAKSSLEIVSGAQNRNKRIRLPIQTSFKG